MNQFLTFQGTVAKPEMFWWIHRKERSHNVLGTILMPLSCSSDLVVMDEVCEVCPEENFLFLLLK